MRKRKILGLGLLTIIGACSINLNNRVDKLALELESISPNVSRPATERAYSDLTTESYIEDLIDAMERRRERNAEALGLMGYVTAPINWSAQKVLYEFSLHHEGLVEGRDYLVEPYYDSDGNFRFFGIFDIEALRESQTASLKSNYGF